MVYKYVHTSSILRCSFISYGDPIIITVQVKKFKKDLKKENKVG